MEKQTFANEMTCHFNLREPRSQRPTNIYCIICVDGKQMKFPTGVKIYPEQWNKKKQEAFISFRLTELDNRNNRIVNEKISTHLRVLYAEVLSVGIYIHFFQPVVVRQGNVEQGIGRELQVQVL